MNKNNKILIIIFIILILILIVTLNLKEKDSKKEEIKEPVIVTDYSNFYMISNCAQRYINYVINADIESLVIVLNNKYKKENNINKDNILSKLDNFNNKNYNFQARKMYYEEISDGYKYYVHGFLIENLFDEIPKKIDYYLIVNVDKNYEKFDITPYDGKIFKEDV